MPQHIHSSTKKKTDPVVKMPICFSSYIIILYIYTLTYQNGDIKSNPLEKSFTHVNGTFDSRHTSFWLSMRNCEYYTLTPIY